MPDTEIGGALVAGVGDALQDFSVASESTDGAAGHGETRWQMGDWPENLGYYKKIPELKTAVDVKVTWTMGAGFETDEGTFLLLSLVRGNGKDSFNTVLKNQIKVMHVGGDSFAEIINDEKGFLMNLKPLDPSTMVIVQSSKGMIVRYEQVSKVKDKANKRFWPEEIFHLSRERVADEIHGVSVIEAVKDIILMRNEAMADWKKVLHRNVAPMFIYHLDTDDDTEIAAFKVKNDKARVDGENIYVPKGVVEPELVATATNASLNPLAWIAQLNDYFFQAVNVPQIIVGNAKEFTDASGKIVYLSYEQSVKADQLYVEEQVLGQLNLEINLVFPATLQNELISEKDKESDLQAAQPNDVVAELEGA